MPADLDPGRVGAGGACGPRVGEVEGPYEDETRLCAELADQYRWAIVNVNLRPFDSEGSKTLAFEVVEQMGWEAPEHIVVPAASGSLLTKVHRGLSELHRVGLLDAEPTTSIHIAQAEGCSPIVAAFRSGI